jgi:hypothetical protein
MPIYRIYVLDSTDHVRKPPECHRNDEAAIEKAHQLLDGLVIEVWEKERKIGRLEPRAAK